MQQIQTRKIEINHLTCNKLCAHGSLNNTKSKIERKQQRTSLCAFFIIHQ